MENSRLKRCIFFLSTLLVVSTNVQGCVNAPVWIFSLPEDLVDIYPGLEEPFIIVQEGEVAELFDDPETAGIIGIASTISEFPIVWCSTGYEKINYTLTLESSDLTSLGNLLTSIPNTGVLPSDPYRFRVCFPCLSESGTMTIVNVTVSAISSTGEKYCPASFFFTKNCNKDSKRFEVCDSENSTIGVQDGYVDVNIKPEETPAESNVNLSVILTSSLIPVAFLCVVMCVVILLWLKWYRKHNKKIASFQPEAVGQAYQDVYSTWNQREPHEKEFLPEQLNLTRELGEGAFGIVYEAKAEGIEAEGVISIVAVKQLRGESNLQMVEDFFREVDFMSRLEHPKVVKLLGVCSQQEPFAMIFEYMDLGDLRSFLRDAAGLGENEDDDKPGMTVDNPLLTVTELLSIALQVAEGMVYISSKHLIHRDLASRNCLVATGLVVKIADFGMSRDVYSSDYYRVHGNALLPVRWMPPESILYGKFSTQTDIWAFGILLWEIFTFGQQPYTGLTNEEVIKCVEKGDHPDIPPSCPASRLMTNCWRRQPKARPSFEAIRAALIVLVSTTQ